MFPKIEPIKAFTDNYIWAIVTDSTVTVVDPGDPNAVEKYLNQNKLLLKNILITHHHYDHTGGITKLSENRNLKVYGPKGGHIEGITNQLTEGSKIQVEGISFEVFETPGHTLDHISYYSLEENILFCGDTLFSGGCGRLFEGTPQQMFTSLKKLSTLPSDFTSLISPSESVAIPAESYPLYSNFFKELIIFAETDLLLDIPIIPHIYYFFFLL